MTLFMAIAACYGVLQLAALGWFTGRSVRLGTLLLAIAVGLYGCGAATLLLQFLYTRGLAAASEAQLAEVVRTASYTVDPFIEEFVKVAPLFVVGLHVRARFQWGLTDYVVLGAGLGAGFGLLEAVLRFSHRADQALAVPGGWLLPTGFSPTYIPDFGTTLGSWLPAPATSQLLTLASEPETFLHLAWSAAAGLGAGVLLRGRGPGRILGLVPIVFVSAEHAALNYDLTQIGKGGRGEVLAAPLLAVHRLLWLYPLICLAIAAWFDLRDVARGRAALPDVLLRAEQRRQPAAIGRFAILRPPWTALIALRFVRLRRSLMLTHARAPAQVVQSWHAAVRDIRDQMDRAGTPAAWQRVPQPRLRLAFTWQVAVWFAFLVPSLVFFIVGGFPATAAVQDALVSPAVSVVLVVILAGGLVWLMWRLLSVLRGLPAALRHASSDVAACALFRLMSGAGALIGGVTCLWLVLTGTGLEQSAISDFHVLDALAGAITAVLLLLALAALLSMFPPGGMALALAGGGALAGGITITPALVGGTAIVGAISGVMLAQASNGGGSAGDLGPGKSARPSNQSRFPEDDFEGTGYSLDDLAAMTYRHTGSGEMHIGGSAPRPTQAEILETLARGRTARVEGPDSVAYIHRGVKVIVNRNMPWQSTAYYIGG